MTDGLSTEELEIDAVPELAAMAKVYKALEALDPDTRARVYDWVGKKWGLDGPTPARATKPKVKAANADEDSGGEIKGGGAYESFAELCTEASPGIDIHKALVAGYWFQIVQGQDDFGSQQCNAELKNYGESIGNITRAFDNLKAQKLVMQIKKAGSTKQGRKRLKLTHKGVEAVEEMLHG